MSADPAAAQMPEFLTDAWVEWLDSTLAECLVDDSVALVLQYRVSTGDGSVKCWHVRIASGRVSAKTGQAGESRGTEIVTLASDRETAEEIAIDGGSAQRAFAEGRLYISGDPRLLLAARPALEVIGTALAGHGGPST